MKTLTRDDILHVAKLSNLTLTEEEIEKFTPQLSKVVDFISELSEVDTQNVKATSQTTNLKNVFREDKIKSSSVLSQDEALSGSKEKHNGLFKVPAILSERSDK